jgi:hypothetical protein
VLQKLEAGEETKIEAEIDQFDMNYSLIEDIFIEEEKNEESKEIAELRNKSYEEIKNNL